MKRILLFILCHVTWPIQGQSACIREIELTDNQADFQRLFPIKKLASGGWTIFSVDVKLPQSTNYVTIFKSTYTYSKINSDEKVHRSVYIKVKI